MSHLDPEQLALVAMGEAVASAEERSHLASCPACTAEVAEMSHAATVARSTIDEAALESPSARVWDRIHQDLALGADVAADPLAPVGADEPAGAPGTPVQHVSVAHEEAGSTDPVARARQPRMRSIWVLAASLALIAVVGVGVWAGISASLAPTVVAAASLDAFPSHPRAEGTAEVDLSRDGSRTLSVTLEGASEADAYREVWLIRNDGAALISLGLLEGRSGTFPIPDGVDLEEYDLVDISFEPLDGDPAHSGDSIVRGQLQSA
ncbi:anti-sigma factor [Microbacterium sp. HD4P20]|uniref:anti-sigma factor domain-containing protein n=1 Tax=Microbacterium sp. HD4P20 TaxID=2864874 RepID=UPI001C642BD2|nr:anti-sigma factor [Microbacterium sp. HD4P20]MCP2636442.1 anti-sigma factor [Microbacterium sp. HD4P20]